MQPQEKRYVGWTSVAVEPGLLEAPRAPRNYGADAAREYVRKKTEQQVQEASALPLAGSVLALRIQDGSGKVLLDLDRHAPPNGQPDGQVESGLAKSAIVWILTDFAGQNQFAQQVMKSSLSQGWMNILPLYRLPLYVGFGVRRLFEMLAFEAVARDGMTGQVPGWLWRPGPTGLPHVLDLSTLVPFQHLDRNQTIRLLTGQDISQEFTPAVQASCACKIDAALQLTCSYLESATLVQMQQGCSGQGNIDWQALLHSYSRNDFVCDPGIITTYQDGRQTAGGSATEGSDK